MPLSLDKPETLIDSSSILGYSYDSDSYELLVWYRGKKETIYRYLNVSPPVMSQIFDFSNSVGKEARKTLRGYPSIKLR